MKKLKVFHNGARLKDIYPHASMWQVFKYRLARFTRKVIIVSFLIGMVVGSFKLGAVTTTTEIVMAEDTSHKIFAEKIDNLKNKVVEEIQSCESAGHKESDGLLIFDTNNKASIGTLQFQVKTVMHYYKVLYSKDITAKEAVLIALDNEKAKSLAKDIMFTTKNMAGKDWYNCAKKFNSDAQIKLIKSFEA